MSASKYRAGSLNPLFTHICSSQKLLLEPLITVPTPQPKDCTPILPRSTSTRSRKFIIPYENYKGAMLGQSLRLMALLRNEAHGDVYSAEDLSGSTYEVKAYTLRGVLQREREYRTRNLKKCTSKPGFLGCLERDSKKYMVFKSQSSCTTAVPECGPNKDIPIDDQKAFPRLCMSKSVFCVDSVCTNCFSAS